MFYFRRHDRNANLTEHVCVFGCNQQVDKQHFLERNRLLEEENCALKAELDKYKKYADQIKLVRDVVDAAAMRDKAARALKLKKHFKKLSVFDRSIVFFIFKCCFCVQIGTFPLEKEGRGRKAS